MQSILGFWDLRIAPPFETFESAVLRPQARVRDLVDQAAARKLYRAHLSGLGRHGNLLWALLVLARWAEYYLPSSPRPSNQRHPYSSET